MTIPLWVFILSAIIFVGIILHLSWKYKIKEEVIEELVYVINLYRDEYGDKKIEQILGSLEEDV